MDIFLNTFANQNYLGSKIPDEGSDIFSLFNPTAKLQTIKICIFLLLHYKKGATETALSH